MSVCIKTEYVAEPQEQICCDPPFVKEEPYPEIQGATIKVENVDIKFEPGTKPISGLSPLHTCTVCSQSFKSKLTLQRHMATHSANIPSKYSACETTNAQRRQAYRKTLKIQKSMQTASKTTNAQRCRAYRERKKMRYKTDNCSADPKEENLNLQRMVERNVLNNNEVLGNSAPKTSAERVRAFRKRKREANGTRSASKTTNAQRCKAYRERKKMWYKPKNFGVDHKEDNKIFAGSQALKKHVPIKDESIAELSEPTFCDPAFVIAKVKKEPSSLETEETTIKVENADIKFESDT